MKKPAVVIPSKNAENLEACVRAILLSDDCRIIVIDDGIDWTNFPDDMRSCIEVIAGEKPFVFSRNVNIGISAAGTDDVVVMNDDAMLQTEGGLTALQCAAHANQEYGMIASTTDLVGNPNQQNHGVGGLRQEPRMLCFICVLVPRRTIETVGLLDERFIHYGCEDDDYSLRVRNAGYKLGVHDGCFVNHSSLKSTFRGEPRRGGNYLPNLELFKRKWGMDNWGRPCD